MIFPKGLLIYLLIRLQKQMNMKKVRTLKPHLSFFVFALWHIALNARIMAQGAWCWLCKWLRLDTERKHASLHMLLPEKPGVVSGSPLWIALDDILKFLSKSTDLDGALFFFFLNLSKRLFRSLNIPRSVIFTHYCNRESKTSLIYEVYVLLIWSNKSYLQIIWNYFLWCWVLKQFQTRSPSTRAQGQEIFRLEKWNTLSPPI